MRILGGKFKGRNIIAPRDIRPVSLRVKKSCFDILRGEIEGKKVLDTFAGSGSLGLEACSHGASECTFIDSEKKCINAIKRNIFSLGIRSKAKVHQRNSFLAINDLFTYKERFDIIFLDPPYYNGLLIKALQALEEYDILARSSYVVGFCYIKDDFIKESNRFSLIVEKKYGQNLLLIYHANQR